MPFAVRAVCRTGFVSLTVSLGLLGAAASAQAAIVINEVESNPNPDFIELNNNGAAAVNIGGYVVRDLDGNTAATVPPDTEIPAGGHFQMPGTGLGNPDAVRLFAAGDLATPIDSFTWSGHAATTYGRCPDGTGIFRTTSAPTPGAANACPTTETPWPGGAGVAIADGVDAFGDNLSGLEYAAAGGGAPAYLWAVRNGPSTLYRLVKSGSQWVPDGGEWATGKTLLYPPAPGSGIPDAEGLALVDGDPNGMYVSVERDDSNGGVSQPGVLRFDVSSAGTSLVATRFWNLTTDLPGLGPNLGLEALTWIPDTFLVAKGFKTGGGEDYVPQNFPNHGTGLFFVGIEQTGEVVAYALNQTADTFTRVASFPSGFPNVMALEFDPEGGRLWAVCDNTCDAQSKTLDVVQNGADDGKFAVDATYERPANMGILNNEGFAIAPQSDCASNVKPVFWSDDSDSGGNALREGTLDCTPGAPPPSATPDTTRPRLTKIGATRKRVRFTLSEDARVRVSISRKKGKSFKPVKSFAVASEAGANTVRFKGRVPAKKIRKGTLKLALLATDAVGNTSAPARTRVRA